MDIVDKLWTTDKQSEGEEMKPIVTPLRDKYGRYIDVYNFMSLRLCVCVCVTVWKIEL